VAPIAAEVSSIMDSVSQMVELRGQLSTLKQQLDESTKEAQKAREGQRAAEQQVCTTPALVSAPSRIMRTVHRDTLEVA
jgi:hypothetical protein